MQQQNPHRLRVLLFNDSGFLVPSNIKVSIQLPTPSFLFARLQKRWLNLQGIPPNPRIMPVQNPGSQGNPKKRVVKDYDALPEELITRIKMEYPMGFSQNLLSYTNKDGQKVSALPFETEDVYYLIRMTHQEADRIIEEDDDYGDDGTLREDFVMENTEEIEGTDEDAGSDEEDPDHYTDIPDTSRRADEIDD
jgi:DNA-directed RNA polymerase subunit delta